MPSATSSVFEAQGFRCVELQPEDIPELQVFFEANPAYFIAVNGEPPRPEEAHEEFYSELPAGMSFTKQWVVGFVDAANALVGIAGVISDLMAAGVWHIGLFLVATDRHGSGDAQTLMRGLEAWALRGGARWLRLGVVQGNARAERFWLRQGFVDLKLREGMPMGRLVNTVRVMAKPLEGNTLAEYLGLMPRDRPAA